MRAAASTLTVIGTALCVAAPSAHALGFGRVSNATQLGQPLNFAAAVRLDTDEVLARECVSAEVISGDNKLQPAQVRVTLEGAADSLERSVRVTTSTLIDEPVVTVSVTLGCAAKVTRRFVAFIDPPLINAAQTAPAETLLPQRNDSPVAAIVTMVEGEQPSRPVAAPASASAPPRSRVRARSTVVARGDAIRPAEAVVPKRPAVTLRQPQVVRPAPPGPRLQLEAATQFAARAASAAAASAPSAVQGPIAAASRPDEVAEQIVRERARIQALEEGLAKLRSDSVVTQKSLIALQSRLKEAESERYANPLVYALAWLSALLALAVAGMWWRQSRARGSAQWWTAPAAVSEPAPAAPPPPPAVVAEPVASAPQPFFGVTPNLGDAFAVSTMVDENAGHGAVVEPTRPAPFGAVAPITMAPELPRELSVEELIDLEQQAEFFIVLGQDDAAIELLMSHVRSDGGISPLPYLKLLEIYRRRGDSEAYQRIRERFNRRFNAYAPDWDSDPQQGRELVDYPDTVARLQGLWASPVRVMETLDASVFRRNKTDETFDLPAYRELLFLYSIARDLAEHVAAQPGSDVDLLLPMGDGNEAPISRLVAVTATDGFQHSEMMTMPLDLDVSFAPAGAQHNPQTAPATVHRTADQPFHADSGFVDFDLSAPVQPTPRGPASNH